MKMDIFLGMSTFTSKKFVICCRVSKIGNGKTAVTVIRHGKSQKITTFLGKISYFDWAMFNSKLLNYQRVNPINIPLNRYKIQLNHYKIPLNHFKSLSISINSH